MKLDKFDRIRSLETGSTGSVLNAFDDSERAEIQWDDSVTVEIVDYDDLEHEPTCPNCDAPTTARNRPCSTRCE